MDQSSLPPVGRARFAHHANNSTTSNLGGFEQSVPPQGTRYKPLPPPPSQGRRISLSPPSSRRPSIEDKPRRSSSIYSRTASLWHTAGQAAPAHDPMPPLHPIYMDANMASVATMSEPQLLLPRTYRPLINSPSPSRTNSPSRPPLEQRPSALLPPLEPHPPLPMEHLHTVPLSKARAAVAAPGAQHLLPEELRAQKLKRHKSIENLKSAANEDFNKPHRPGSTFKPHETDVLRLPSMMMFESKTWQNLDAASPVPTIPQHDDQAHEVQSDGERGRSMQRMPRKPVPIAKQDRKAKEKIDAALRAAEYSALLSESSSPFTPKIGTDDEEEMRRASEDSTATSYRNGPAHSMPQPLFAFKSPPKASGELRSSTRNEYTPSASPTASPKWEIASIVTESTIDSDWTSEPPPADFFKDEDQKHEHGSIPISPGDLDRPPLPPSPTIPSEHGNMVASSLKTSNEKDRKARESAYYPYVGSRRPRKTKTSGGTSSRHHLKAQIKQQAKNVPVLLQDVKKKAVRAVDTLARPLAPITVNEGPASIESPHLTPTTDERLDQSVTAVYLGWSEETKSDFDASKPTSPKHHYAQGRFNAKAEVKPTYTHVAAPARPLDERGIALVERPTRGRQTSIFGSLLESQREKGREKKREEIKKTIRLIPNSSNEDVADRPGIPVKLPSESVVQDLKKEPPPKLGLWGRRISEFGLI